MDDPRLGFSHHHTPEELREYRALSPEQKLAWLQSAWKLTADFLPDRKLEVYQRMRRGGDRRGEREVADSAFKSAVAFIARLPGVEYRESELKSGVRAMHLTRRLDDGSSRTIRVYFAVVEPDPAYNVFYSAFGDVPMYDASGRRKNIDGRTYGNLEHVAAFAKAWIGDLVELEKLPIRPQFGQ